MKEKTYIKEMIVELNKAINNASQFGDTLTVESLNKQIEIFKNRLAEIEAEETKKVKAMPKEDMLSLIIGDEVINQKTGKVYFISEISFEVLEDGIFMYGGTCKNYAEVHMMSVHPSRKKVVRFYLVGSKDNTENTLVRESTIKNTYRLVK